MSYKYFQLVKDGHLTSEEVAILCTHKKMIKSYQFEAMIDELIILGLMIALVYK